MCPVGLSSTVLLKIYVSWRYTMSNRQT
ncbi:MAG TPA: cold-shock protein, partial [Pseudomonas sp.]|nr:cold-shock protein [Pseudomonas sp.]